MSDTDFDIASAAIRLMQGVVYRDSDEETWTTLNRYSAAVKDHFATVGLIVEIHDDEGFAFLRTRPDEEGVDALPRVIRRRPLSYPVSLLLVLLRRRLAEFETSGDDGALVMSSEQIIEMIRVFQAESTNDARVVDTVRATISKVVDLGFLRPLRGDADRWEVRRILKAYVDAQTMGAFERKLREYGGVRQ
jgi:hypothetical protein